MIGAIAGHYICLLIDYTSNKYFYIDSLGLCREIANNSGLILDTNDWVVVNGYNCSYITYERIGDLYEYINTMTVPRSIAKLPLTTKAYDLKDQLRAVL